MKTNNAQIHKTNNTCNIHRLNKHKQYKQTDSWVQCCQHKSVETITFVGLICITTQFGLVIQKWKSRKIEYCTFENEIVTC